MTQIGRPNLRDSFMEGTRTAIEYAALNLAWKPLVDAAPRGDGAPVLVMPGFGGDDWTTRPLRRFLREIGYYVHGWRNGVNIGLNEQTAAHLRDRLDAVYRQHGRKVTLIGHSLGGIFARELAREFPDKVERVVTLGSPFGSGGHPKSTVAGTRVIYGLLNPGSPLLDDPAMHARSLAPPPVPTTSLYSRHDGVVNWKTCVNPPAPRAENVEIRASHCGIVLNPVSLLVIADRLAQSPQDWRPFERGNYPALLFRSRDRHEDFTPGHPDPREAEKAPAIFRPRPGDEPKP